MKKLIALVGIFAFLPIAFLAVTPEVNACTRIFWNTNPDLMIVGRTVDYITASHPTFVATPRGVKRWGTADKNKRSQSINWTVGYIGDKSVMDTPLARMSLERGGSFRVGLEDWPNGTSNVEQIKRAKEIINAVGRPLVTEADAIKYLDIPYPAKRPKA